MSHAELSFLKNTPLGKVFLIQYGIWYFCFSESYYYFFFFFTLSMTVLCLPRVHLIVAENLNCIVLLQPALLPMLFIRLLKAVPLVKCPVFYWLYWCFLILEYSQGFCCTLWDDTARSNEMGSLSYKITSTGNEPASVKEFDLCTSSKWDLNFVVFFNFFQTIQA